MRTRPGTGRLLGALPLAMLCLTLPAAGSDEPEEVGAEPEWSLRLRPTAWYVAPGGRVKLPGTTRGGRDIDVERVNLDSPRVSLAGWATLLAERWRIDISGFAFTSNERGTVSSINRDVGDVDIRVGDRLSSSLDFTVVEASAGLRLLERRLGGEPGVELFDLRLDALAGVRVLDVRMLIRDLDAPPGLGASAEADETFIQPTLALSGMLEMSPGVSLDVRGGIGGWVSGGTDHSLSWEIQTGVVLAVTHAVRVRAGYRLLSVDLDRGSGASRFEFRGSMAGLYAGIEVRF